MNPSITRIFRPLMALGLAFGLSACASGTSVYSNPETATRNAPITASLNAPVEQAVPSALPPSFHIAAINVAVPSQLRVNEANRYYPGGDIVWREDPIGNRHEQVKTIVHAGLSQGAVSFTGEKPVVLDVVVSRFHALTEKARYAIGGVHAIQFDLTVRDAETGAILVPAHNIKADFDALGGRAAVAAESRGVTQKVRITNHLANVIRQELGHPAGYAEHATGILGAINQL